MASEPQPTEVQKSNPSYLSQLPRVLREWLKSRALDNDQVVRQLLSPSLRDLSNPYSLHGMKEAVDRLWQAYLAGEKVAVYADFDMDGTPGLSLLMRGLRDLGFDQLEWYQPLRLAEGYGVHVAAIERLKALNVRLIVTVDVGITAVEAVEYANQIGMDVIITDHHLPGPELPDAVAVVNPNKGMCSSGLGHLCGAGVAFYLLMALKMRMTEQGACPQGFDLKNYLDDFAIATLSDMVPLVAENRVLIKHGLEVLKTTRRAGLRALLDELGLSNQSILSTQDITMKFVPKLNALSRLERGLRPIEIFFEEDPDRAKEKASQLIAMNQERRDLQQLAVAQIEAQEICEGPYVFDFSSKYHKGVIGLVANDLTQRLGWPSFIGSYDEEKSLIAGSARAPEGVHLVEALKFCEEALEGFGGHAQAAGFQLKPEKVALFQEMLSVFFKDFTPQPMSLKPDCQIELMEVNEGLLEWLERLEPFGQGFDYPLFAISKAQVKEAKVLKGGHLRLRLRQNFSEADGIFFSPPEEIKSKIMLGSSTYDIYVELQRNYFNGKSRLQLLIRQMVELE